MGETIIPKGMTGWRSDSIGIGSTYRQVLPMQSKNSDEVFSNQSSLTRRLIPRTLAATRKYSSRIFSASVPHSKNVFATFSRKMQCAFSSNVYESHSDFNTHFSQIYPDFWSRQTPPNSDNSREGNTHIIAKRRGGSGGVYRDLLGGVNMRRFLSGNL